MLLSSGFVRWTEWGRQGGCWQCSKGFRILEQIPRFFRFSRHGEGYY